MLWTIYVSNFTYFLEDKAGHPQGISPPFSAHPFDDIRPVMLSYTELCFFCENIYCKSQQDGKLANTTKPKKCNRFIWHCIIFFSDFFPFFLPCFLFEMFDFLCFEADKRNNKIVSVVRSQNVLTFWYSFYFCRSFVHFFLYTLLL